MSYNSYNTITFKNVILSKNSELYKIFVDISKYIYLFYYNSRKKSMQHLEFLWYSSRSTLITSLYLLLVTPYSKKSKFSILELRLDRLLKRLNMYCYYQQVNSKKLTVPFVMGFPLYSQNLFSLIFKKNSLLKFTCI